MTNQIEKITVPAQPGLDPVFVFFDNIAPGAGRVIIVCWDMAWTGYWGAIGKDRTIQQFFLDGGADYLMGNISQGKFYKRGVIAENYLKKIINSVKAHMTASLVNYQS